MDYSLLIKSGVLSMRQILRLIWEYPRKETKAVNGLMVTA